MFGVCFLSGLLNSPSYIPPFAQLQQQQQLYALNQNCSQIVQQQREMAEKIQRLESALLVQNSGEEMVPTRGGLLSQSQAAATTSPFHLDPQFANNFYARYNAMQAHHEQVPPNSQDDSCGSNVDEICRRSAQENPFRIPEGVYGNLDTETANQNLDEVLIETIQAADTRESHAVPKLNLQAVFRRKRGWVAYCIASSCRILAVKAQGCVGLVSVPSHHHQSRPQYTSKLY